MGSTLHYGGGYPLNGWPNAHVERPEPNGYNADFHKFQVNWTPDFIEFSVDDASVSSLLFLKKSSIWIEINCFFSDWQN